MNSRKYAVRIAVIAGIFGIGAGSANAAIMDQIGNSPAYITSQDAYLSDFFESGHVVDDTAVVDDFTVSGPTLLTRVLAATDGYGGFVSYSDVTSWSVEIYSSEAKADTSLVGDVYSRTYAPAGVTLTNPFGGSADSALFNASTAAVLPTAGTYYIAVIAGNSFTANGEIGIYASSGAFNSTPGGLNANQFNPQGGLGFSGNQNPLGLDAAYAVEGVAIPEPASAILFSLVAAGPLLSRRRRVR